MRVIYLACAYSSDPHDGVRRVRELARSVTELGDLPVAPQLFLPQFLDEATERDLAMACCLKLVSLCDELRAYGEPSEGMKLEIAEARRLGIPIVHVTE